MGSYGHLWKLCFANHSKKPGQTSMASQLYIVHTSKFHGISHRIIWFGLGTSTTAIVGRALLLKKNSICWTKEGNITNITGGLVNYSKGKKCNHALPNSNENHLLWCRSRDFVAHIKSSCRRETFDGHVKMQVYSSIMYSVYQTKNISEIVFYFSRPDFRLGCYLLYWLDPNFHHLVCRHN